jgi:TctA family transporter
MTLKGQAETALGAGLWFSAVGGLFGTLVMIFMAPSLAEVAIKFSSFEYFWLVVLGLASAVFIGSSSVVKALISLLLGLLVACIGLENPAGHPRFTFGVTDLLSGVELIPMMVGMFAVSEILRYRGQAEVLEPAIVREEVAEAAAALLEEFTAVAAG